MLMDKDSGAEREVDLLIRQKVAGHEVIVSVEAIEHGRVADVTWVDAMLGKHDSLPTNKLVLVSDSGFTRPARTKAETRGAVPITPQDLDVADPDSLVIGKLDEVWPKSVSLTVTGAKLVVMVSGASVVLTEVAADLEIVREDGSGCTHVQELAVAYANTLLEGTFEHLAADVTDSATVRFEAGVEPVEVVTDGGSHPVFLRFVRDTGEERLDQIMAMQLELSAIVSAGPPIQLTHRQIAGQKAAYGTTTAGDDPAVLVVVDAGEGEAAYLRVRKVGEDAPIDVRLKRPTNIQL